MRDYRKPKSDKTVGRGYVGVWSDGTLGWSVPSFVHRSDFKVKGYANMPNDLFSKGHPHYLCEITVKLIRDKKGRYRMRRTK